MAKNSNKNNIQGLPVFNNGKSARQAQDSVKLLAKFAFWMSTISSAIAIAMALASLSFSALPTAVFGISIGYIVYPITFSLSLYFCYVLDQHGVAKVFAYFFEELFAWIAGGFYWTSIRVVKGAMVGVLGAIFFALSFVTSWYGSGITSTFASVFTTGGGSGAKVTLAPLESNTLKEIAGVSKETNAYYDKQIADINKKTAESRKFAATKNIRAAAAAGDASANAQLEKAKAALSASADAEIKAVNVAREKALAAVNTTTATQVKAQEVALNAQQVEQNRSHKRQDTIHASTRMITLVFGTLPLIAATICMALLALWKVTEEIEGKGKGDRKASGSNFAGKQKTTQAPNSNYSQRGSSNF